MRRMVRLIVIEDDAKHVEDVKSFAHQLARQGSTPLGRGEEKLILNEFGLDVLWLRRHFTKRGFNNLLKDAHGMKETVGVVSDVFFPLALGEGEEYAEPVPNGIAVALTCKRLGLPFVLVTDAAHHSTELEWIEEIALAESWPLFWHQATQVNGSKGKPWALAFHHTLSEAHERGLLQSKIRLLDE